MRMRHQERALLSSQSLALMGNQSRCMTQIEPVRKGIISASVSFAVNLARPYAAANEVEIMNTN
jgi:hypothetical protein